MVKFIRGWKPLGLVTLREAGVGGGVPVYVNGSDKVDRTLLPLAPHH